MPPELGTCRILGFFFCLLCGLLANSSAKAADNWVEVKCPHFTVAGNSGEKDLRKICDQFELYRSMFRSAFPSLQVDPGTPIEIIAAKNEATMKELLPDMYEVKGHSHAAGLYQAGPTKIYVILQMNLEGDRPYHVLYHEYTHTLVHLNFFHVPLWLDEGLAEYLGNASLDNKQVRIGLVPPGHLYVLQQNKLLPIETLMAVDHGSPYYNEASRTSVFYAESWALTHYLMLDQKARQDHLLPKFLDAYTKTGDQVAAAKIAFGDLKKVGETLDNYSRAGSFYNGIVKPPTDALDKNYASRALSHAEAATLLGEFLAIHGRPKEAKELLDAAAKEEPNSAALHEALGLLAYRNGDWEAATREMEEAIRLGTTSFAPYYMVGVRTARGIGSSEEGDTQAIENLNKAIKLNPNFAPAYDALALALRNSPSQISNAVNAELQAVKFDSSNMGFVMNFTFLLLAANRDAEAAAMADKLGKAANTEEEKRMAEQAMEEVKDQIERKKREKAMMATMQNSSGSETKQANEVPIARPSANAAGTAGQGSPAKIIVDRAPSVVDGAISEAVCGEGHEITITLGSSGQAVRYHTGDVSLVEIVEGPGRPAPELTNCQAWKGRLIRVWFQRQNGKQYAGEIMKLYFF
jgi:tetratricopeptide (TPR) repeat protein